MSALKTRTRVLHPHTKQPVEVTAVRKHERRDGSKFNTYRVTGGCHFSAAELEIVK